MEYYDNLINNFVLTLGYVFLFLIFMRLLLHLITKYLINGKEKDCSTDGFIWGEHRDKDRRDKE